MEIFFKNFGKRFFLQYIVIGKNYILTIIGPYIKARHNLFCLLKKLPKVALVILEDFLRTEIKNFNTIYNDR